MISRLALLAISVPALMLAQSNLRVVAQLATGVVTVVNGGSLPVQSGGRDVIFSFVVTNTGTSTIALNQVSVSGADFALAAIPSLPVNLQQNESTFFTIRYTPISGSASTGQISLAYTEGGQSQSFNFTLSGTAPSLSYTLVAADGTRTPVVAGGKISFGQTRVNAPQTMTLAVLNSGGAPATINQISLSGTDYNTSASFPFVVSAGQEIGIPITFTPRSSGLSSGAISLASGFQTVTFPLEGIGAVPEFLTAYALRADGNTRPLTNGAKLTFMPIAATTSALADVTIINQGNVNGLVRSVTVTGTGFQLVNLPLVPATVGSGQTFRFGVQFSPQQLGSYSGSLRIEFDDRTLIFAIEGSTTNPDFTLSYIDPASRNVLAVANGGTLPFAPTTVNSTASYTVVLRNQGGGTGFVNAISITGEAFELADLPPFPATINTSAELRFTVRFTPRQRQSYSGSLQVNFTTGSIGVSLAGSGIGPSFSYEVADPDAAPVPVSPGAELTFSAAVGQTASKTVRISNMGNSEAAIAAISVSGAGFQVANVPFLPVTIPVNGTQTFTVSFSPSQPGRIQGRLQIGNDMIDLAGTGLAARLEFAFTNEAGTTAIAENGIINFSPARVGESSQIEVSVKNTGTAAQAVSSIDVTSASGVFSAVSLPALPFRLDPGTSFQFPVRFIPNNTGTLTGSLRINNSQLNLSGTGQQPVPVPEYRLEGPSSVVQPMQQPAVGLTLTEPYPLVLRGTLILSFFSDVFTDDPAVQLVNGSRTIGFTVPANTTRALFDNGSTDVRLQTGTVAGSIQLRPTFSTVAGLDLTPASPALLTMTINRAAPRLLTAEISSVTANTVNLMVTGYSTTRALRQVTLELTPQPGEKLASSSIPINIESTAFAWFQSGQSQPFGGLFSLSIPLVLQRNNSQANLVQSIRSLSVSVSNETGSSNALTVP